MRPLKLTMTAFGPYAQNEEIDFTILNNKNIFLITGPTGAGKTTIFDGISYAIYGEASGEDRDGESLRSQFADVDTLTSVELEFELKGTKYYIKRTPKQEKRKSRGEGTTEQKTDAEMKIIHSDEQVKVISGVSNVNDKINEIMGINYAQFKQIMMIPQGEFRKLLVSESKDREKILQKIFGTEAYKLVEIKLNDRAREIKNIIKDLNNKQSENISTIQFDNNTLLMELIENENRNITEIVTSLESFIEEDIEKRSSLEKSAKESLNELEKNQKKIFEAKENNKKFEEKEELEKIKNKLESQQAIMDLEKERLIKARKAAQIDAVEENYIERNKDLAIKKRELELNLSSIEVASKGLIKAEEVLKVESSKEEEKIKLLEYASVLKGYREKVKVFEDENASLSLIELQLNDVNNKKNEKKQLVEKIKKDIEILSNKLEVVRKASSDYIKLNAELEKTNQIYNKISDLHSENKKLISFRNEYLKYKKEVNENKKLYEEYEKKFRDMEQIFRDGQAGVLALGLNTGDPCPVCGSTHHPKLAKLEHDVPTEDELKKYKKLLEEAKSKYDKSDESFRETDVNGRSLLSIINRLKDELNLLIEENILELSKDDLTDFINNKLLEFESIKEKLYIEVKKLDKEKNQEEAILKSLNEKKTMLQAEEKKLEKLNDDYTQKLAEVERKKGILNQLIVEIPENLRSERALKKVIEDLEARYEIMCKALKDAQNLYNECKLQHEKLLTENEGLIKSLNEVEASLKEAESKLNEEIIKSGFKNLEDYKTSKLNEEEVENLNKKINEFNEKLRSVKDRYEKSSKDLEGLSIIDISTLLEKDKNIKDQMEVLEKEKTELHAKITRNKNSLLRINELSEQIKEKEKEYSIIGDLAEVSKGNNTERMTFERYVLAAFFDEIIEKANLRLGKMTEYRYELDRIKEKGKGLTQSGLELQVFDNYTGKYRHVKTLSGGESFKASLALALGLADVVQCYAGGISIDTIFIDEGFGTLDPESLDNAIQCLIDLQNYGRLVGIISHVPELKERIDSRLEIIPSAEGSTTKFNVR